MLRLALFAVIGAFLVSLFATILVRAWARRCSFIDRPGGHKRHDRPLALGGGIAITVTICAAMVGGTAVAAAVREAPPAWLPPGVSQHLDGLASKLRAVIGLAVCVTILHVVGLFDDRRALGPWSKLAAQFAVALFTAGVLGIRALEALPPFWSAACTVGWIVLITNAFNFLDNMDGLSAGVAAIAALVFALAAMRTGQVFVPVLALVVVGTLAGFLVFNFAPASIIMGDAGSLVVGYLMSVLTILTTFYDPGLGMTPWGVLVPLVVLAVPLYDVGSVVVHRLRAGDSPFRGDNRHFSHRLVRKGLSRRGAVLTIYLATAATGLPAILLATVDWTGAALILLQCLCVVTIIAILEHATPPAPP